MNQQLETGSYILRSLVRNIDLKADDEDKEVVINCVELLGTSAGELLHHVRFPGESAGDDASYILASRQKPPVNQDDGEGIQQILLLPSVGKACVLSSNTLSFYTLPELSPAFPNVPPLTCGWVGGLDLDVDNTASSDGVVIMLCLRNRIRLVKVGNAPTRLKDIEYAGCKSAIRRGDFACVADACSYTLLHLTHQQKIPLFPISSEDDQSARSVAESPVDLSTRSGSASPSRALSPAGDPLRSIIQHERGHRKSSSLNHVQKRPRDLFSPKHGQHDSHKSQSDQSHAFQQPSSPPGSTSRRVSTTDISSRLARPDSSKPLPPPPPLSPPHQQEAYVEPVKSSKPLVLLRPLIASPSSDLFLLVTGTRLEEPSVGVFVNLDGDVDRGTIEFPSFPQVVVTDGKDQDTTSSLVNDESSDQGFVLAVLPRQGPQGSRTGIEIQRWGSETSYREWLSIDELDDIHHNSLDTKIGLKSLSSQTKIFMPEVVNKLALKPLNLVTSGYGTLEQNPIREQQEEQIFSRLCNVSASLTLWRGNSVYWLLRNPLLLKLDAQLRLAQSSSIEPDALILPNRICIENLFQDITHARTTNELDFYSLAYIRQKAALLLFMDLALQTIHAADISEHDISYTEHALIQSELDPRPLLSFLPNIRQEISHAPDGVWLPAGLRDLFVTFHHQYHHQSTSVSIDLKGPHVVLLHLLKRLLIYWRLKKGNPSVVDGQHVFYTVDAALLHILLILDSQPSDTVADAAPASATAPALAPSRAELYAVIDHDVACFDRSVQLLEQYQRLYVLGRLYQRRKSLSMVLSTWKRILTGEVDVGGEFIHGEHEMRQYLSKLKDRTLVIEYATWLANRNPKLGAQVFADESSCVIIPTAEALILLRRDAPNAVKDYLELLVFGKKHSQHVNELLAYYIDIVLVQLSSSPSSCALLAETYTTYRALHPPKPTYRQFITDNAIPDEWWHSRLRLLHLLGSNHGPASSYNVAAILHRLLPYSASLVPEMILLSGRQGQHQEALSLLVHGLSDFDTAISYCLLGGSSIFRSPSGFLPPSALPLQAEQSQLFTTLLLELLKIDNDTDKLERTAELLERFGPWFDLTAVLTLLPDHWALQEVAPFLVNRLDKIVADRRETGLCKALWMARNLSVGHELVQRLEETAPVIDITE